MYRNNQKSTFIKAFNHINTHNQRHTNTGEKPDAKFFTNTKITQKKKFTFTQKSQKLTLTLCNTIIQIHKQKLTHTQAHRHTDKKHSNTKTITHTLSN